MVSTSYNVELVIGASFDPELDQRIALGDEVPLGDGDEAGMVYVVNAEEGVDARYNLASIRNRLFTAIMRSKAWVRVLGVGPRMDVLVEEFNKARDAGFTLSFRYPTDLEREKLTLLHSAADLLRRRVGGSQWDFRCHVETSECAGERLEFGPHRIRGELVELARISWLAVRVRFTYGRSLTLGNADMSELLAL